MTIKELNPELFSWELYDAAGMCYLDDAIRVAESFGYCDASRLTVRPRAGEFALMIEWSNGERFWFHISKRLLELVKKRIERMNGATDGK